MDREALFFYYLARGGQLTALVFLGWRWGGEGGKEFYPEKLFNRMCSEWLKIYPNMLDAMHDLIFNQGNS